jgi:hypothetical protein
MTGVQNMTVHKTKKEQLTIRLDPIEMDKLRRKAKDEGISLAEAGRGFLKSGMSANGYALKAGQLTYDCRYSTMHGMPVTGGRGFRGLKPLWYNGVPP